MVAPPPSDPTGSNPVTVLYPLADEPHRPEARHVGQRHDRVLADLDEGALALKLQVLRVAAEHGQMATPAGFDLLLQLFDSTLTYRSLYPGRFEVPALIDLLVVEPTNPRGLYGVYSRLCTKLNEISIAAGNTTHGAFSDATLLLKSLRGLEQLCTTDEEGNYGELIQA